MTSGAAKCSPPQDTGNRRIYAITSVLGVALLVWSVWSGAWIPATFTAIIALLLVASWWRGHRHAPAHRDFLAADAGELNEFGRLLNSELMHVEEEITRVDNIIGEAASGISGNFHQLYELSKSQNILIQELFAKDQGDQDIARLKANARTALASLAENRPELEQAIAAAVQSLQFEDISSQALNEAQRSLAYLRTMASELEAAKNSAERLIGINRQYQLWANKRRKPVSQQNLDEGSVELF